ncbi:hypothetical protein HDU91_000185, partial [Kappamyces sp. JEL0680]
MQVQQQLGKQSSTSQVCKDVMQKFKTKIEHSRNQKTNALTLIVQGQTADAVQQSKKLLQKLLCAQVTETMMVPVSATPYILGKGGVNLKDLISRTGTKIQVSRWDDSVAKEESSQVSVSITGQAPDAQQAKRELQDLVAAR